MADVAGVRPIELLTIWIGARQCRISFLSWRHRYHGGPPLIGNGPEDTDSTPVVPCYYSPGLPERQWLRNCKERLHLLRAARAASVLRSLSAWPRTERTWPSRTRKVQM